MIDIAAGTPGRRRVAPYLLAGLGLAIAGTAYLAGIAGWLDSGTILAQREALRTLAASHPLLALPAFAVAYIGAMSLALPLGAVLGLTAGLLFGLWLGTGIVVLAGTISALVVFRLARGAFGGILRRRAGPAYDRIASAMRANAFAYLLFMRIVPVFPFFVVNLVAAAVDVRMRTFLLATLIGKMPATFLYVGLGQEIGRARSLDDLMTLESVLGLAALGALALVPPLYRGLGRKYGARAPRAAPPVEPFSR